MIAALALALAIAASQDPAAADAPALPPVMTFADAVRDIESTPDAWPAYRALVDAAMIEHRTTEAEALLRSPARTGLPEATLALAMLARRNGDWRAAYDLLHPVVDKPHAPLTMIREYLEAARALKRLAGARAGFVARAARAPADRSARYGAGYAAALAFDWTAAERWLRLAAKQSPSREVWLTLATIAWDLDRVPVCLEAARAGLAEDGPLEDADVLRIRLLVARSRCTYGDTPLGRASAAEASRLATPEVRDAAAVALAWQAVGRHAVGDGRVAEGTAILAAVSARDEALGETGALALNLVFVSGSYGNDRLFSEKIPVLDRAVILSEQIGDTRTAIRARGTRGASWLLLGRHADARRDLLATYADARRIRLARAEAANAGNLSELFTALGDFDRALEFGRLSAAASRRTGIVNSETTMLLGFGDISLRAGDLAASLAYHRQAVAAFRRIGEPLLLRGALLQLGRDYEIRRDWAAAGRLYRESLAIADRFPEDRAPRADAHAALADLARQTGRLDEALERYRTALSLARGAANENVMEVQARHGLGLALRAGGKPVEALDHFRAAIDRIETIRSATDLGELRTRYFADKRALYVDAIDTLADLDAAHPGEGHAAEAFALADRVKARSLRELIASESVAAIDHPSPAVIASRLAPDDLLLQFLLGAGRSYLFTLDRTGAIDVYRLPSRAALQARVLAFRQAVSTRPGGPGTATADVDRLGRSLSRTLFGAAAPRIASARRLVVAGDGVLFYLPFAALRASNGQYLGERHEIVGVPSASMVADAGPPAAAAPLDFIGFADPVLHAAGAASRDDSMRDVERAGFSLAPLPGSAREVARIASLFDPGRARAVTGSAFTRDAVVRELQRPHRIVHFATHAIIDDRVPSRSGIVVSPAPGGGAGDILQVREFERLRIPADLVTLSACQTGLGRLIDGEGVAGLAWGLQRAGARALLVTLWNVSDATSPQFMLAFYQALRSGQSKAAALRAARRALLHGANPALRHPYYWAGYALVGD